jgi:hypothetical protein
MKQLSVFLVLFSIFSCSKNDPNDAVIQAKVERIVGTWEVTNLKVAKSIPDSLKAVPTSFRFYFPKCNSYKANKSSYPTSTGCHGQIEVDKSIFSFNYYWDIPREEYTVYVSPLTVISPSSTSGTAPIPSSPVPIITPAEISKRIKTNELLAGIYTLDIKENEIVFTQIANGLYMTNVLYGVSFTAKRVQ